ncbi:Bystin [Rhypophila decipiens]
MPKATTPTATRGGRRHNPLSDDIVATGVLKNSGKRAKRATKQEDEEGQAYVDAKASRKILDMSRDLIDEEEKLQSAASAGKIQTAFDFDPSRMGGESDQDDDFENDEAWGDEDEVVEEIEVDVHDMETFDQILNTKEQDPLLTHGWDGNPDGTQEEESGTNLADLILAKIAEKESANFGAREEVAHPMEEDYELPPKAVEVYTKIGLILARYKSGPLPKPFKVLPTIPHWEDYLALTRPDQWTPNACYEATRIFVSAKSNVVQKFTEMVILDRVRDEIHETKKLNVHLFKCLKRALYKPASFFKGFLFPLAASGTCTLREAQIVAAVLTRVSIPVLHSAAAIKTLCDIAAEQASQQSECVSATNFLLKVLLEKKYALPWQCIDSLVFHFLRYAATANAEVRAGTTSSAAARQLPVIFHQCLLAFAERYRNDITEDQREALLDLLLNFGHEKIAPEIRRELLAGRGRGVPIDPIEQDGPAFDGDDTMVMG